MKHWLITLKDQTGKHKDVKMPGGLSEPEAVRNACLKPSNRNFSRLAKSPQLIDDNAK